MTDNRSRLEGRKSLRILPLSWLRGSVVLLAHRAQLPAPFPYSRHRFPKFFVRDVQVPLPLFDVRVADHQLDRADVHAIAQEPTGAFVTEVVPVQVDLPELLSVDACTVFRTFRVVAVATRSRPHGSYRPNS